MSGYHVQEVSSRSDLDAVADCIWAVMSEVDSAHKVLYPVFHPDDRDRERALNDCKGRLWSEHTNDPSSHWVFVRDKSSDELKVLGAGQWRLYGQNPFPHGMPDILATWWPEGSEGREFASEFMRQCLWPRAEWMGRAHSGLSWCVVLPSYQRQGIGQAIMAWGLRRTDEMELESYIEATEAGRKLYERCGYRFVAKVNLDMEAKGGGGEERKSLERRLLPCGYDAMWRPVGGAWMEGEPKTTWGGLHGRLQKGRVVDPKKLAE